MTVWSESKRKHLKNVASEISRINGEGHRFIPFARDGWRRRTCRIGECRNIFYTAPMTHFQYKARERSCRFCPSCDQVDRDWKRLGTEEDDKTYLARCEAHGVKITRPSK